MGMTWLSGVLPLDAGYHPRHRSTRRDDLDIDRLEESWHEPLPEQESGPADTGLSSEMVEVTEDLPAQCFLDQMTVGEVRRILEGCALHDVTRVVPELVQLIAHSSHTPATMRAQLCRLRVAADHAGADGRPLPGCRGGHGHPDPVRPAGSPPLGKAGDLPFNAIVATNPNFPATMASGLSRITTPPRRLEQCTATL